MAHEERFIPPRQKLDQLSIIKDYATVPRLEYRYVDSTISRCLSTLHSGARPRIFCSSFGGGQIFDRKLRIFHIDRPESNAMKPKDTSVLFAKRLRRI